MRRLPKPTLCRILFRAVFFLCLIAMLGCGRWGVYPYGWEQDADSRADARNDGDSDQDLPALCPEEMVEIVETSRKAMVERMTKNKIPDPAGRQDYNKKTGKWETRMISNPYFKEEFSGAEGRAKHVGRVCVTNN